MMTTEYASTMLFEALQPFIHIPSEQHAALRRR